MKKKITLMTLAFSLLPSLLASAAQAPIDPSHNITYQLTATKLTLPSSSTPFEVDITQMPFGETDTDMPLKTLMKATHTTGHSFCFVLCKTPTDTLTVLLTDGNLRPYANLPEEYTSLEKYMLFSNGKGFRFPPHFVLQQQPRTVIQQTPYPVPAPYPVPYRVEVPQPFPVFVPDTKIVTIPYFAGRPDHLPSLVPAAATNAPVEKPQNVASSDATQALTQGLQDMLTTMQQKTKAAPAPSEPAQDPARLEQEKRDTELKAKQDRKDQEDAQREQEKACALAAEQKIQEDTEQRKKIEDAAALQAKKDAKEKRRKEEEEKIQAKKERLAKQEEIQKILDKEKQEQRAAQALRDKEAAVLRKAAEEERVKAKQVEKESAQQQKGAKKTTPVTKSAAPSKPNKKEKDAKSDDDFLAKAIVEADRERQKMSQQPNTKPVAREEVLAGLIGRKAQDEGKAPRRLRDDKAQGGPSETGIIKRLEEFLEADQYAEAYTLLKQTTPATTQRFIISMTTHPKIVDVLSEQDFNELLKKVLVYAQEKTLAPEVRCDLYFLLAKHTQDQEKKEVYLTRCTQLNPFHAGALVLTLLCELEEFDNRHPICPSTPQCIHCRKLAYVERLQQLNVPPVELTLLIVKLLVHATLNRCTTLRATLNAGGVAEPRVNLIGYYGRTIRILPLTRKELAEINALIPTDIMPADQRRHE